MINESSKKLATHLNNRHPPPEKEDINLKLQKVQSRIYPHIHEAQNLNKNDILNNSKALKLFKSLIYNWSPISYNKYISLAYLISRSVPEYSVLYKIFNEIVNSDKNFIPKTLFDYGSGTGTVIW